MKRKAFTLIELIVVISIIALLIAVMVPGYKKAKEAAKSLSQRCQLRDIEVGLEAWATDRNGEYPDSRFMTNGTQCVSGAQRLCEALVGRDLMGFDEDSSWNPMTDESNENAYPYSASNPFTSDTDRLPQYVDSSKIGTAQFGQIYGSVSGNNSPYTGNMDENGDFISGKKPCYLFTDVFRVKSVKVSGKTFKVGSPVLYYKANSSKKTLRSDTAPTTSYIYNFTDNFAMMQYGSVADTQKVHPYWTAYLGVGFGGNPRQWVEDLLSSSPAPRIEPGYVEGIPYNKDTFLLLSAGPDGLYGTKDDIWNISNRNN